MTGPDHPDHRDSPDQPTPDAVPGEAAGAERPAGGASEEPIGAERPAEAASEEPAGSERLAGAASEESAGSERLAGAAPEEPIGAAPLPGDEPTGPTEPLTAGDPRGGERAASGAFAAGAAGAFAAGGATPPPPPPIAAAARRLTRSSSDRVLGGVSAGLGRYFGIDPILFRIAFVVLTFIGGAGALAYAGAWLFVPSEDAPAGSRTGRARILAIVGAAVLVLAALPFLGPVVFLGGALLPVALVALLVVVLVRAAGGEGGDATKVLARIALALLVVAVGVVAVFAIGAAAAFGGDVVIAGLLVTAGVALLVGAFVGGARWLIVPALLIALPLGVVAAADLDVGGGVGERNYRPASATDLRPAYELGAGELVIDLRDVDLPPGRTDVAIDLGMGEAIVFVPDDACVSSDVQVGAGYAQVLDRENGGLDVDWQESPRSGSAPRLHIQADVAMGAVQVVRDDGFVRGRGARRDWRDDYDLSPAGQANANAACAPA